MAESSRPVCPELLEGPLRQARGERKTAARESSNLLREHEGRHVGCGGMILPIHPKQPQDRLIQRVVSELRGGAVIGYPTETIYGIGCDITNKKGIQRIHAIKQMGREKLLAFVCSDLSHISEYARVSDFAYRVMKHLVPGPYTFVLPASRAVPKILETRRKTVGIRVPEHPIPANVVRELGEPIVSTSAIPVGGDLPFNDAGEMDRHYGNQLDLIIDGGPCGLVPSTVLDLTGPEVIIVRQGKGPTEDLLV